jgi:hypothetical protein
MCGSLKVRSLAAQQSSPLFGFCFLTGDRAKPSLSNLFPRFWSTSKVPMQISVALSVMLFGCKAFKIFYSVVSFISVNVVNMFARIKSIQPTSSHNTVHKPLATKSQVAHIVDVGCVRLELSENFSATRNGIQMVKKSIFDTVYLGANHVVPFGS